jgi:hypothetical protein
MATLILTLTSLLMVSCDYKKEKTEQPKLLELAASNILVGFGSKPTNNMLQLCEFQKKLASLHFF